MSSHHQYMSPSGSSRQGEIEHSSLLAENLGTLCCSSEYSDVVLIVEGQQLPAHKVLLAARSEYFRALLYGGMKEANQVEVELKGAPLHAFRALLRYIYTGHMSLMTLREEVVLDILGLAHQYDFQDLESAISEYLRQVLALRNVCAILDTARLYGLTSLVRVCHTFLDRHALDILGHESLLQLSQAAFCELLKRDSFFAPEVAIFKGASAWCQANPDPGNLVMQCVRLPLMTISDIISIVRPCGLVDAESLLDAIGEQHSRKHCILPHRGQLLPDENVASHQMGSMVTQGELKEFLLDGDVHNYDMERGYSRHAINGPGDFGIVVTLGAPSIINHIKMLLWDKDLRSYSYYIEVSVDLSDWIKVVDHNLYYCRSWQYLYFEPRVVKHIRIVGTNNTVNKVFHLVSLEAMYKQKLPHLSGGLIVPKHNVATLELSASVVEGVSRSRNALLNGDTEHYDWDYGYTCHQLGSGSILVQLGQPYLLSSMRLLLWDIDDRTYSYYVESSVNMWDWEVIVDRTRENCRSWQTLRFPMRPIVFIRIVGTHNTANEVFHCVHLECPAQDVEGGVPPAAAAASKSPSPPVPAPTSTPTPTETATEAEEALPK